MEEWKDGRMQIHPIFQHSIIPFGFVTESLEVPYTENGIKCDILNSPFLTDSSFRGVYTERSECASFGMTSSRTRHSGFGLKPETGDFPSALINVIPSGARNLYKFIPFAV